MPSSGSTPNIYVMTKENKIILTDNKYTFEGAIQTGQFAKQTFYIVNYHPDASSTETAHSLYGIKLKLECTTVPSGENKDLSYIHVYLGDFGDNSVEIDTSKELSFTDNGATADGAVKTANGSDTLKGCGKNPPSCSTPNDEYIAITVQAFPKQDAKAGTYSYTLSISGKYT